MGGAVRGGIIAAGEGSRLRRDGFTAPKPLVEVAGVPLIGAVLRNFEAAGVTSITIIVNEDERECVEWVRAHRPALDVDFIVKTTASSLESFREVTGRGPAGPMLVSTVDAWCAPEDFANFAAEAARRPDDATVLAVTPFVSDEKPLWVTLGSGGEIRMIGPQARHSGLVTAGFYVFDALIFREIPVARARRFSALREFLGHLLASGYRLYGEPVPKTVDVDRPEDIAAAEAFIRSGFAA